jgi:hypothetical protein
MRNKKHRFKPKKNHQARFLKSKPKRWGHRFFALAACGLLFSGLHPVSSIAQSTTLVAGTPDATSMATNPVPAVSKSLSLSQTLLALAQGPQSAKLWTNYVGDEACLSCHQDKVNAYHRTAHYFTSSWPTKDSIHGSFSPGSNILKTQATNLFFRMDANENGFFQTAVLSNSPSEITSHTERFGIVIGSGRKGQTYLYWHHDRLYDRDELFELPVSYWVERGIWMNSPGLLEFPDGTANFTRPVTQRCLECHTTSFEWLEPAGKRFNMYNKTNLVLGIICEKCHGPGGEHVARYRSPTPPTSPAQSAIVNPARLPRGRQMDVCGLCHAGAGFDRGTALSFKPGDVLTNYLEVSMPGPDTKVDVHGNQYQLLQKSRCFQSSSTMTCFTCHDVHVPQRDINAMASNCLTCHHIESCGKFVQLGHVIDNQCVVCHMPLQQTASVLSSADGKRFQPKVRNHQIAIYPDVQLP